MSKLMCRTRYTAPSEEHKGIVFEHNSLTQQHFKEECDINEIARRYLRTGVLEHVSDRPAFFADVSDYPVDLATAYSMVNAAEDNFMKLPSEVRKSIDNNPALLLDWISNHHNDAVKFGLLNASVPDVPEVKEEVKENILENTPESNLDKV